MKIISREHLNNNTITTQQQHKNNTKYDFQSNRYDKSKNIQETKYKKEDFYGKCKFCNRHFKKQQSLSRHQLNYCKKKVNIQEEITKKEKELNDLKQIINNTTNNNTTNNSNNNSHNTMNVTNNNTININNYGSEDYSSLDKEFLKKLSLYHDNIKYKMMTVLDKVYLENKDNHNVIVSSKDGNHCKILNDNKEWETTNIDKVLDYRMYNSVEELIRSTTRNHRDLKGDILNNTLNGMNKYQKYIEDKNEKLNKKDKKDFNDIREDHKLKLYNLKNN